MTGKAAFSDEEWQRISRARLVVGRGLTVPAPDGPCKISKEGRATIRSATVPPSQEELLAAVALDIQSMIQQKHNPAKDFKPTSAPTAAAEILDELRAVDGIVAAKATPEETEAFREWLIVTAQAAADAAKEGGFMGFGAERVSAGEQAMLDKIRSALRKG